MDSRHVPSTRSVADVDDDEPTTRRTATSPTPPTLISAPTTAKPASASPIYVKGTGRHSPPQPVNQQNQQHTMTKE
jgi:hypothetical protein